MASFAFVGVYFYAPPVWPLRDIIGFVTKCVFSVAVWMCGLQDISEFALMSRKILWVEDDPTFRRAIGGLLVAKNFQIIPVTQQEEALHLYTLHREDLSLIIADATRSGPRERALAELNFQSRMTPFVLFTSLSEANIAVELLDFGVRDFLTKPVTEEKFLAVVNNAMARDHHSHSHDSPDLEVGAGADILVIRSRTEELDFALEWIRKRTDNCFASGEMEKFLCFVNEYLLNAHEHGNLRIPEEEKIRLLECNSFLEEVRNREESIDARIEIAVARIGQMVKVAITDEGGGFDFGKYMDMDKNAHMNRLFSPCGRGILMTCHYFDSIEFTRGGSCVTLTKVFQGSGCV